MNNIPIARANLLSPLDCFLDRITLPTERLLKPTKVSKPTSKPDAVISPCTVLAFREATLEPTAPTPDFPSALRQLILVLLPNGYPDVVIAAKAAGMSTRSFQRRLAENHLKYSYLVEQVRLERAIWMLQAPAIKVIDIAFELGYEDPANFTRAFKRWTGVSPRQFRCLYSSPESFVK